MNFFVFRWFPVDFLHEQMFVFKESSFFQTNRFERDKLDCWSCSTNSWLKHEVNFLFFYTKGEIFVSKSEIQNKQISVHFLSFDIQSGQKDSKLRILFSTFQPKDKHFASIKFQLASVMNNQEAISQHMRLG